ncbi:Aldose 1-epimerase [Acidisarcina polymorpha]|uniref:Putative glucose-6-phosphate 1-epimerase n=1 Tax=Acidisarcina polymorpha TaxID=2211140 RepID=A0A2Z5FSM8_9BACT|nr:D-hexose-6-phosphate mutarotase [Acidisarcina polymorpha]AXC09476.1 Aldose 1-epimerase [Acidisarcina polymorpha]
MEAAVTELDIQRLNDRFAIPSIAQIVPGNGGLPKVKISSAAASAEIYLHGAHLTSWIPAGAEEVIFLSDKAQFQDGKAIRGGVPVCFPWFNAKADDPKAPSHGFVRTKTWELESIIHEGNAIAVALSTQHDQATQKWWPHDFHAVHKITIGSDLKLELSVTNTGAARFNFQEALHTYYRVGDVRQVRLSSLDGVTYLDNADNLREKVQQGDNIFTQRTDNAYINTESELELSDPQLRRRILIGKQNSKNTVVWNPGDELARGMADLGDEEWQHFVCVEAANIRSAAITLEPGEEHTMTANIRLAELH